MKVWRRKKRSREEGRKKKGGKRRGDEIRVWNEAGIKGKREDFWEKVKKWDVVRLVETWVEGKEWERMRKKLPVEYSWKIQEAKKEKKKRKAMGGIIMGIRKEWVGKSEWTDEEGLMVREVCWEGKRWGVGLGYIREKGEKQLSRLAEISEEKREIKGWLMGGDFNARTGEKGEMEDGEE